MADPRFLAPAWRIIRGRLTQVEAPLGRDQVDKLLTWSTCENLQYIGRGKPWPEMQRLIERGLMWSSRAEPAFWSPLGRGPEYGWKTRGVELRAGLTQWGHDAVARILGGEGGFTVAERQLARHALGFDKGDRQLRRSYRNRFYTPLRGDNFNLWMSMAEKGLAEVADTGRQVCFALTRKGAELALSPGEALCPEDFPPVAS